MSKKHLGLIGPADSVYLRLIQREADKTGLPVLRVSQRDERCGCYVIDSEAENVDIRLTAEEDIDCVQHPGMSCVAEAALHWVKRMSDPRDVVGLVGRKHAVQGLAEALVHSGRTVIPVNRALPPKRDLHDARVLVNSAPKVTTDLMYAVWFGWRRVIDISGSLESFTQNPDWNVTYVSRGEIGKKNVEILLDRAQVMLNETREVNNETH